MKMTQEFDPSVVYSVTPCHSTSSQPETVIYRYHTFKQSVKELLKARRIHETGLGLYDLLYEIFDTSENLDLHCQCYLENLLHLNFLFYRFRTTVRDLVISLSISFRLSGTFLA